MVSADGKIDLGVLASTSGTVLNTSAPVGIKLSIALIGPQEDRRKQVSGMIAELDCGTLYEICSYPELDEAPQMLEHPYDVILMDLDAHPEHALALVESLCSHTSATVMVYSECADPASMIRCMRAGVREFLTSPFTPVGLKEALTRASARQVVSPATKGAAGVISVFFGAKGGCGVTTIASNFAFLLARESAKKTLLIDLDLPLGDVALALGVTSTYSTVDALENFARLDTTLLSKLLVQRSPNLFVLTSPGNIASVQESAEAIHKLLTVSRQEFEFIVVDAGARLSGTSMPVFGINAKFYMVSRVRISDLRNANRIISKFFADAGSRLEIVLNRYVPSALGVDDDQITKALTRRPTWKVPEDSASVRKAENNGTPIAESASEVTKAIVQMARVHGDIASPADKRNRFFGLLGR